MRRRALLGILSATALLLAAFPFASRGRAELLYFKAGGRLQAPASVQGGLVDIDTGFGHAVFRESDFSRIVPGFNPEAEWPSRRAVALQGKAPARLAAAWWALENGLVEQSEAMIEEAHQAEPDNTEAARLAALVERLRHPLIAPDTTSLQQALGASFEQARREHVLLLHQHPEEVAQARLDVLEHIVSAFYLMFAFHGFELPLPTNQLVTVYLRDRETYIRFLERQNAGAFRSTQGYFHPTFRVVLAYDLHSAGPRLTVLGGEPGRFAVATVAAPVSAPPGDDGERQKLLHAMEESGRDLGTASHELVHLLVWASRLEGEPRRFPYWLAEGLAAQFEVYRGGRWAGIGRAHDLRLPIWRAIAPTPALALLVRDVGFGRGYQGDLYAESWALVRFLQGTRPRELLTFIDLLRNPDDMEGVSEGDRYLTLFTRAFGDDLGQTEKEWLASTSGLQTPLEIHAPGHR
jgi:Protein of unknown function (DUF1570)